MNWLYDWVLSGLTINLYIQSWRTPALDILFILLTALGSEEFYLITIPIFYWLIDKNFGKRLAYLFLLSSYINIFLKNLFDLPRPFQVDGRVVAVVDQDGYGLPSGHAQLSLSYIGFMAWSWRQRIPWAVPTAVGLIFGITFSRLYLGVHFLADVLVGLTLGALILWGWLRYQGQAQNWLLKLGDQPLLILGLTIPIILLFLMPDGALGYPAKDSATICGVVLGVTIGLYCEAKWVRFTTDGTIRQKLVRYLVGGMVILFFWGGLRVVFAQIEAGHLVYILLRFIRYAITACALAWFAPALFVRFGVAGSELARDSS